jgi:hypothetical protein
MTVADLIALLQQAPPDAYVQTREPDPDGVGEWVDSTHVVLTEECPRRRRVRAPWGHGVPGRP